MSCQPHMINKTKEDFKQKLVKNINSSRRKKKNKHGCEKSQYKNLPEDEKQRLVEYR